MRVASSLLIFAGFIAGSVSLRGGQTAPKSAVANLVDAYCSSCHNGSMRSPSGVLLDQFDAAHIADRPDVWSRAYRQLQAGTMPPVGAPRPDQKTYNAVLKSIEQQFPSRIDATPHEFPTSGQIAERLAKLLWNGAPDEPLLQDAQRNRLIEPPVLERHIHRMLADERAETFVSKFFFPWLGLDKLSTADPDKKLFPDYDPSLCDAFQKETQLFLLSQLRDDRDPVELWSANYTFLNDQLAQHYNVANIEGPQFRKVTLQSPERAGLLGQGSVLMATSRHGADSAYTSPASRSVWIRLHFLGAPPPMPFPGAQPVKPELPITPQTRTLPLEPCVTCHRNFFPLGYALENFDPLGRWRTQDQIGPVDASGTFVDGTPTNGVVELRKVLLQRPEAFRTTITEGLVNYAAGKPPARIPDSLFRARQILGDLQRPRWSAIIAGVVRDSH